MLFTAQNQVRSSGEEKALCSSTRRSVPARHHFSGMMVPMTRSDQDWIAVLGYENTIACPRPMAAVRA
jgi:hypothetical protein